MTTTRAFSRGAVATPHYLASLAGAEILAAGGNAVDAVVAANLALGVVAPYYCGVGGDLLAMVWDGTLHGYRSTGRSPAATSLQMLRDAGHQTMPYAGAHTVTVPGAVRGWFDLLERFGSMSFDRLARRAVELARDGFVLTRPGAFRLRGAIGLVGALGVDDAALRSTYHDVGVGATVRQGALGELLCALGLDGPEAFYTGSVADAICAAIARHGGSMDVTDLAAHEAAWVDPLYTSFAGHDVAELPPPTQGVSALEMLALAERFDMRTDSVDRAHLLVEIAKVALADRDAHVGDPDAMRIAPERLLDAEWITHRAADIDEFRSAAFPVQPRADGGTAYLCAADRDGLYVSLIQSNFTAIGSGVHVPEFGINLHNRGAAFTLAPDTPNTFGPRKLPLHTLIPAMVLREGRPSHVYGTMGGHAQAQIHLQVLTRLLRDGSDLHAAVAAPRWAYDPGSGELQMEDRFDPTWRRELEQRGHSIRGLRAFDDGVGHSHVIAIASDGALSVAADPRAESAALGH